MFCCFNKGQIDFAVSTDKNAYVGGEKMQIIADMNNRSTVNIRRTIAELYNVTELHSDSVGLGFKGSVNRVERRVSKMEYPGVGPNQSTMARALDLFLDPSLQQQALGFKVRSYYYLNVRVDVPWGFDSKCRVPMCIYAPQPPAMYMIPPPVAPIGFNPQIYQSVQVPLPSAPAMSAPGYPIGDFDNLKQLPPPSAPPPDTIQYMQQQQQQQQQSQESTVVTMQQQSALITNSYEGNNTGPIIQR